MEKQEEIPRENDDKDVDILDVIIRNATRARQLTEGLQILQNLMAAGCKVKIILMVKETRLQLICALIQCSHCLYAILRMQIMVTSITLNSQANSYCVKTLELILLVESCGFPIEFINNVRYTSPNSTIYYNRRQKTIVGCHNYQRHVTTLQKWHLTAHIDFAIIISILCLALVVTSLFSLRRKCFCNEQSRTVKISLSNAKLVL